MNLMEIIEYMGEIESYVERLCGPEISEIIMLKRAHPFTYLRGGREVFKMILR